MTSSFDSNALVCEAEKLSDQIDVARKSVKNTKLKTEAATVPKIDKLNIKEKRSLCGHMSKIYSIDWHVENNSHRLLTASQDGYLISWNAETTNKVMAIPLRSSWVMTCAYSPSGKFVASGGLNNICTIYNLVSEDGCPFQAAELFGHMAYISSCKFIEDSKILTTSGDQTCILWDIERKTQLQSFSGHTKGVMAADLQPGSNSVFATGACDCSCKIWDIRQNMAVQSFKYHEKDVNDICFFPNGQGLVSASEDGTSKFFDLRSDQKLMTYHSKSSYNNSECITSVAVSKSGRLTFNGRWDNSVQVFDTLKGDPLLNIPAHQALVQCIRMAPTGQALATGSWDATVKIWA